MPKTNIRLSKYVSPQRYDLLIRPDFEAFTFSGEEAIDLILGKTEKSLTLHSKDLEIIDVWYKSGKQTFDIKNISYNDKAETATFAFGKVLPKGKGKLFLKFRGIISDKLHGMYRSHYMHQGEKRNLAITQFESTDARRAFPCFDEPAHKSVFNLSLSIPNHMTAISNTVETGTPEGVDHDDGYKIINFAPTPKMSTYLLAYIIGDFENVQIKTKHGVTVRVFFTRGKKHQAKFALETAKRSLEFLNEYFAAPYALPTLDLIAVPDLSAAGMENWGAVTFRESSILIDEQNSAFSNRQHVAEVIAHEIVHQWFGNLVTMEWWTHLWLNESFAEFMSYVVMDELHPEWRIWTRFVMLDHNNALQLDSLDNTHPVEVEVYHPDEISQIFDAISYHKGASVLRMLQHYIGHDNFRDGLRYYLKKHSFKNTKSVHLWEAFEKISKKPVRKFMKKWISESGYPLIRVEEPKAGKVAVSQSRFKMKHGASKTLWPVPIQFELGEGKLSEIQIHSSKKKMFSISNSSRYLKANPDETAYYRTLYSPSLLAKLHEPIRNKELSVTDRFGVIRDLFALCKAGALPTSAYLEFLKAYKDEDSYIVWKEILSGMFEVYNIVEQDKQLQKKLADYYLKILKKVKDKVGWEIDRKESQSRTQLRSIILRAYGSYGDSKTIATAKKTFSARKKKPVHPDLRSAVYSLYGEQMTQAEHKALQKDIQKEQLHEEHRRLGRALMSVNDPKLFAASMDFTVSENVRLQDAPLWIFAGVRNPANKHLAWKWVKKNWNELHRRYHGDHLMVWIIKSFAGFTDNKTLKEIEAFFKANPVPSATRALKQALENIRLNSAWYERDKNDIKRCINQALKL